MKLCDARETLKLLHLVNRTPQSYRQVVVCAPYIREDLFLSEVTPGRKAIVPTIILTIPDTASRLAIKSQLISGPLIIKSSADLHAKVYLLCGKDRKDSQAIIGSSNLTQKSISANLEISLRLSGRIRDEQAIIDALERKLLSL